MSIQEILEEAVEKKAADIFLIPGMPASSRIGGRIVSRNEEKINPQKMDELIRDFYVLADNRDMTRVQQNGDDDFSMAIPGLSRFRANVFRQRGSLAAVIRVITFELPDFRTLNIPQKVMEISKMTKGMVLVTGPAGSGKSTTLACIIDEINRSRNAHVITLEDPIEYLHRHNKSVVTQREIATDTVSYVAGLRAALRQAPDVILLGEMRDEETIRTAMTAAETGHLVISTLHTVGAANTIDRIVDSFPSIQQEQIRMQLSMIMQAVVSQQLIPGLDDKEHPAFEIMFFNNAIRSLIRENKVHQIDNVISTSQGEGMMTMDSSLLELFKAGKISKENAVVHSSNGELMEKKLARLR